MLDLVRLRQGIDVKVYSVTCIPCCTKYFVCSMWH